MDRLKVDLFMGQSVILKCPKITKEAKDVFSESQSVTDSSSTHRCLQKRRA